MRLSSISMARVLAFLDLLELNPSGKVFLPALIPRLVERFQFQKYPTSLEDFDTSKGVTFQVGYFENTSILKLVFYNDGLSLETRTDSAATKNVLLRILEWLRDECGLTFTPSMIKRWGYVTDIVFYSEADMTFSHHPALQMIIDAMASFSSERERAHLTYKATKLAVDFDRASTQVLQVAFRIETVNAVPFTDKKYFSESPFPSELHIKVLEEVEAKVLAK